MFIALDRVQELSVNMLLVVTIVWLFAIGVA